MMMNNSQDPDLKDLLDQYQAFLIQWVYPLEMQAVYGDFKAQLPALMKLREKAKTMGLYAPHLPKEKGGLGLSLLSFAQVSACLGASPLGHFVFNCQAPDIGNMELLEIAASESIKQKYLHPLEQGHWRSCFAMTEPDHAGSNPLQMSTTASADGDGYRIQGHKWFTTAADGASFCIVMAITDAQAEDPYSRASMFLVPMDTPGLHMKRNIPIMGDVGSDYLSHGELIFQDCWVPQSHVIGEIGKGFALAQQRLGPGRIHHCMRWIGICQRVLEMMCDRALDRNLTSSHTLADQQSIQHWIAESAADIQAARLMVLDTASAMELHGAKACKEGISTIKFFVSGVLTKIIDRAIQVHGALGITDDTLLSFWYRHERGARIYDGPDEVHKMVLAKSLLKQRKQCRASNT